jgi:hypothetical protein
MTWLAAFLAALPYADRLASIIAADRKDKRARAAKEAGK